MAGLAVGSARLLWFPIDLAVIRGWPAAHPPGLEPRPVRPQMGWITVKAIYDLGDEARTAFGLLQALYTQSRAYGWILDHHSTGVTIRSGNSLR